MSGPELGLAIFDCPGAVIAFGTFPEWLRTCGLFRAIVRWVTLWITLVCNKLLFRRFLFRWVPCILNIFYGSVLLRIILLRDFGNVGSACRVLRITFALLAGMRSFWAYVAISLPQSLSSLDRHGISSGTTSLGHGLGNKVEKEVRDEGFEFCLQWEAADVSKRDAVPCVIPWRLCLR